MQDKSRLTENYMQRKSLGLTNLGLELADLFLKKSLH
jgi:hypothetical protein